MTRASDNLPDERDQELEALRAKVARLEAEAEGLRASVRVARSLIEETPLVIYAKGIDQRFVLSNRRHAELVGKAPGEIVGRTDRELFGNDADAIDAVSARVLRTGEADASEFALPIGGRERTFLETIFRMRSDDGEAIGLGGIATDITERKDAEAERRMLWMAVEQSNEAVVITDLDCNIEFVNDAYTRQTGYAREELIGQNPRILQSGKTPRAIYDAMWAALIRGETWRGEFTNRRKDGSEFVELIAISPVRQGSGRVTHYLAIKQDVTEHRRMTTELERHRLLLEERVRQRSEEIKAIFAALPDLYFRIDRVGVVLDYIAGREAQLAAPPAAFMGRTMHSFVPPEVGRRFEHALAQIDAGAPSAALEYELTLPAGAFSFEARMLPLGAEQRVVVVRDITDRRRNERALAAARDAAEAASRVKSDFLACMSHEVRTPLTAILGYTELLGQGDGLPADATDLIARVHQNAEHLLQLVDDILDVSRIEAGTMAFARESVALSTLLSAVETLLAPFAKQRGLSLSIHVAPEVPSHVSTDAARLRQIVANLVQNGLKFASQGGVTVRARLADPTGPSPPWLCIEVSDTGPGIAPEVMPELFKPFTQLHGREAARGRGVGLGLAICARLAEGLGGRLDVRSELGVGSTFTLRLPVERYADAPKTPRPEPTLAPLGFRPRVLVVDDNADLQRLFSRMLDRMELAHEIACNGQEALDLVTAAERVGEPFDLILMDMQMPVLDGYEATRALRARGTRVHIVALTAFAMPGDGERCIAAGCDEYLAKPINLRRLNAFFAQFTARIGAAPQR